MALNEQGTITLSLIAKDLMSGNIGKALAGLDKLAQKGGLVGAMAQGVGQSFGQMLNPVGLVSKGIGFLTDTIGDSIGAASDLQESISKVNVVFGDSADQIQQWSQTSSQSVLLSRQAALEAAGTFGNLFDALGLTEQATVDMSKGAVQLAADLGSFNNVSTEETLLAIRSGLLGEAEPMRKFGSALTAARVESYALAQGWVKNKGALTEAMKVQARYELIMQDTANAQGDVARSSGNLAAQQKQLDANMANLSATVGQALIGPLADFTGWINDLVGSSGSGGKFDLAIADLEKLAEKAKDAAIAVDPGAWFLSGTVFDSALDGLNALNEAVLDAGQTIDDSVKPMMLWGKAAGATGEMMFALFRDLRAEGRTVEDFRQVVYQTALTSNATATALGGLGKSVTGVVENDIIPAMGSTRRATGKIPGAVSDAFLSIPKSIKDAKKPIRAAMAEINWALKHPLDAAELDKFYDRKLKEAYRKLRRAQNTGNARAVALARQLVRDLKSEMNALNLSIIWTNFTPSGKHGATRDDAGSIGRKPRKKQSSLSLPGSWQPGDQGVEGERAMGGHVMANRRYLVGENGPEWLEMGTMPGYVTPGARSGGMTLVYAPGYSTASPAEAERFAREVTPHIQRAMDRKF